MLDLYLLFIVITNEVVGFSSCTKPPLSFENDLVINYQLRGFAANEFGFINRNTCYVIPCKVGAIKDNQNMVQKIRNYFLWQQKLIQSLNSIDRFTKKNEPVDFILLFIECLLALKLKLENEKNSNENESPPQQQIQQQQIAAENNEKKVSERDQLYQQIIQESTQYGANYSNEQKREMLLAALKQKDLTHAAMKRVQGKWIADSETTTNFVSTMPTDMQSTLCKFVYINSPKQAYHSRFGYKTITTLVGSNFTTTVTQQIQASQTFFQIMSYRGIVDGNLEENISENIIGNIGGGYDHSGGHSHDGRGGGHSHGGRGGGHSHGNGHSRGGHGSGHSRGGHGSGHSRGGHGSGHSRGGHSSGHSRGGRGGHRRGGGLQNTGQNRNQLNTRKRGTNSDSSNASRPSKIKFNLLFIQSHNKFETQNQPPLTSKIDLSQPKYAVVRRNIMKRDDKDKFVGPHKGNPVRIYAGPNNRKLSIELLTGC